MKEVMGQLNSYMTVNWGSLVPRLSLSRTRNYLMTFAPAESICPRVQRSSLQRTLAGGEPGDEAIIGVHSTMHLMHPN